MTILPETLPEFIAFCETHVPVWEADFATLGITSAQASQFKNLTSVARASIKEAQEAREASKAATITQNAAVRDVRDLAADLIRTIKAHAENQATPAAVYASAQIPTPRAPSPLRAPGEATNIRVTLESGGAVTLSWQAQNAAASSGAFYNVLRKLPGQSNFTSVGGAPGTTSASRRMRFTDATLPASAAGGGAQYIIQGQRGADLGEPSEAVVVQFGVGGAGSFQINGQSSAIKMAA